MEYYYIPLSISLADETEFSIIWFGNSYRVFDHCVIRPVTGNQSEFMIEVSPWGFVRDSGNVDIANDTRLLVGEGCTPNEYDIQVVTASRNLFNAPNMTPFEPIYFLGFFALGVFIFTSAIKTIFGGRLR